MHKFFIFISSVLLFNGNVVLAQSTNPPSSARYIVKLKSDAPQDEVLEFFQKASAFSASSAGGADKKSAIQDRFNDTWFQGFTGEFNDQLLAEFNQTHGQNVEYIVPDNPVKAYLLRQNRPPSWGLARLSFGSQRGGGGRDSYIYPESAGEGVDVWVLDSGIYAEHPEFQGRAHRAASFVPREDNRDLNGHGTHVAGTIAGASYGVAKKAQIYAIKVLDRNGDSWDSRIIAGINYAIKQHKRKNNKKLAVMNLSLGGEKSRAVDEAVRAAVNAGIVVVVAAGNEHMDACKLSPAGSADAFAVGAINTRDRIASFSNYGRCVRVYAPGDGIVSAGNNGGTRRMSGTSMASPHVAGVAALYIADRNYQAVQQVYQDLQRHSQAIPVSTNLPNFRIPSVVLSPSSPVPAVIPVPRQEPQRSRPEPRRNRHHRSQTPNSDSSNPETPDEEVPNLVDLESDLIKDQPTIAPNEDILPKELPEAVNSDKTNDTKISAPQLNDTLALNDTLKDSPVLDEVGGNNTLPPTLEDTLPSVENSTNATLPVNTSQPITLPVNNSTDDSEVLTPEIRDVVDVDGKGCQSGAFTCNGKDFMKCDHERWVKFSCAPSTVCRQISNLVILCDHHNATEAVVSPAPVPAEESVPAPIELGNNDTIVVPGNTTSNNGTMDAKPVNYTAPILIEPVIIPQIPVPAPPTEIPVETPAEAPTETPVTEKKPEAKKPAMDDGIHLPL